MLTMQEALIALNTYWTEQGCQIAQPMNSEVGAGTLNPATFLRVQGPEPWHVAYTEPSVRPDDSRYGANPNRLQTHTQYQVILKPEPGNPQELYLGSLEALGIDTRAHDVRFVEDNWASPALGAWGLGWEVWLDGLEITQFTYFQQAGGNTLDPVSVEITYGMERIMMALQGVSHFRDIAYAPGISYGEAFGQNEYEMSRYYLDDASIEANHTLFDTYAGEADRMLGARLPVPAYSFVLKCSHTFNVLDARGAVSTTERARAFARMRGLARRVATLWAERREELGHPLGTAAPTTDAEAAAPAEDPGSAVATSVHPTALALEIGVEEMPPGEITRMTHSVREALAEKLAATHLGHGAISVVAAPRRVIATVEAVEPAERDREETARGPRVAAAFDENGRPTRAAAGFARAQGVEVSALDRAWFGAHEHVVATRHVTGRPALLVLAELLPEVIGGLRAEKNMRWSAPGLTFTRPVRWLLALLGEQVVPFTVAGLRAGRTTRLQRTPMQPTADVPTAEGFVEFLAEHGILADAAERRRLIEEGATRLATQVGGQVDVAAQSELLAEVTNLVEQPTPVLGSFDESYLELPEQILTTVMRKHQRFLPVHGGDGKLMPYFITLADGECDRDTVRLGNESVLRARYEDAAFFWRADLETPLARMREKLNLLTFEERLGSMADRAGRIAAIAGRIAASVGVEGPDRETLERAGQLVKFDLGSQMVTELPSLEGVMAREYALRAGEDTKVATALFEAELPRFAGDSLPESRCGALLALADRFDLLAGLFAVGLVPTGRSDPYALRRSALGIVNTLRTHPELAQLNIRDGLAAAAAEQPVGAGQEHLDDALKFVVRRFEQQLQEEGRAVPDVRAVLPHGATPALAEKLLAELESLRSEPRFEALTAAVQRVRRILPPDAEPEFDPALFEEPAESSLSAAVEKIRSLHEASAGLRGLTDSSPPLVEAVNEFFDSVLVMAEDPAVRANRFGLLASVRELTDRALAWEELN